MEIELAAVPVSVLVPIVHSGGKRERVRKTIFFPALMLPAVGATPTGMVPLHLCADRLILFLDQIEIPEGRYEPWIEVTDRCVIRVRYVEVLSDRENRTTERYIVQIWQSEQPIDRVVIQDRQLSTTKCGVIFSLVHRNKEAYAAARRLADNRGEAQRPRGSRPDTGSGSTGPIEPTRSHRRYGRRRTGLAFTSNWYVCEGTPDPRYEHEPPVSWDERPVARRNLLLNGDPIVALL